MSVSFTSPSYLTADEADLAVAANLPPNGHEARAWAQLDATGKDRVLGEASAALDAIRYRGKREYSEQLLAFPRVDEFGAYVEPDPDESDVDYSLPNVPRSIRIACAIQAATIASRDAGTDPLASVHTEAAAGITSQSGRGHGRSLGPAASTPWASLTTRVQKLVTNLRSLGGGLV